MSTQSPADAPATTTEARGDLDKPAWRILAVNTFAFAACFAAWMLNGPLVTFLTDKGLFSWSRSQIGMLIAVPVLTGAVLRLPAGVMCDRFGGRIVFTAVILISAVPMFLVSYATRYADFVLAGLGFGIAGSAFAAGVAYTSVWFDKARVGTALGIFGMGNAGAAATSMFAPLLLRRLTATDLEGWRTLPKLYAVMLVATAALFWFATEDRRAAGAPGGLASRLAPLRRLRVWRFGMYYAFFFGGFIALSQWLIPYYVNVYTLPIVVAGPLAGVYSLSSSGFRAMGGWLSDKIGARWVVYWSLALSMVFCLLLFPAAMVIHTPGQGVLADADATVTVANDFEIRLSTGTNFALKEKNPAHLLDFTLDRHLILPTTTQWQEPVVKAGQSVRKGDLLAAGTTRIFFQANRLVFTGLVFLLAVAMGFGMAGVYTLIPLYFPTEIGVVGGLVGVLGGLGGFFLPIVFGVLLEYSGLWTTCWIFLFLVAATCLIWMHVVIHRMTSATAREQGRLEDGPR